MSWQDFLSNPGATAVIGAVGGALARQAIGQQRWARVVKTAQSILADPHRTNDPEHAVREAWANVYDTHIKKQADALARRLNGKR